SRSALSHRCAQLLTRLLFHSTMQMGLDPTIRGRSSDLFRSFLKRSLQWSSLVHAPAFSPIVLAGLPPSPAAAPPDGIPLPPHKPLDKSWAGIRRGMGPRESGPLEESVSQLSFVMPLHAGGAIRLSLNRKSKRTS